VLREALESLRIKRNKDSLHAEIAGLLCRLAASWSLKKAILETMDEQTPGNPMLRSGIAYSQTQLERVDFLRYANHTLLTLNPRQLPGLRDDVTKQTLQSEEEARALRYMYEAGRR
jgi:hypothetical protein